jgi:hypothetical protein
MIASDGKLLPQRLKPNRSEAVMSELKLRPPKETDFSASCYIESLSNFEIFEISSALAAGSFKPRTWATKTKECAP